MTWIFNASPEIEAQSRYPLLIAITVISTAISATAIVTRLYLRRKDIRADDIVIGITLAFAIAYASLNIYDTRWGSGLAPHLRPAEDVPTLNKLAYANRVYHGALFGLWKIAACLTYLRLMEGSHRPRMKQAIHAVLGFAIALHITYGFGNLLFCVPIQKNWHSSVPGQCINFARWNFTIASITIVNDVLVWSLPLPMFLPLQMDRRTKIGLISIFLLGFVTTIFSIARAVALQVIVETGDNFDTVLYQTIEFNLALISICLPFLRPLLQSRRKGQQSGSTGKPELTYEMNSNSSTRWPTKWGHSAGVRSPGSDFKRTDSNEKILSKGDDFGVGTFDFPSTGITRVFEIDVQRSPAEP